MKGVPATTAASDLLQKVDLRRTPVRLGVLQILERASHPLAVPQLLEQLPAETDAVTVYRTLNTFTRKKLVHRVRGDDRTWRYALGGVRTPVRHQHPHFVCDECGVVECLENSQIPSGLIKSLRLGHRYAVTYPEVVLHGVCPRCHT